MDKLVSLLIDWRNLVGIVLGGAIFFISGSRSPGGLLAVLVITTVLTYFVAWVATLIRGKPKT
jgi:hypothetical protein